MLRRSPSLALRATLIFVAVYVLTVCAAVAVLVFEEAPSAGEDHHAGPAMALAFVAEDLQYSNGLFSTDSRGSFRKLADSNPALWAIGHSDGMRFAYGPVPPGAHATFNRMLAISYTGQFYVPGVPRPLSDAAIERRRFGAHPIVLATGGVDPARVTVGDSLRYYGIDSLFLILFGIIMLGLVGMAAGLPLLRLALRPVAAEARSISPDNPRRRLDESRAPRELLPLVRGFNAALDRLSEELSRRNRFITDLAHELRTPIAIVRGRAENLKSEDNKDELLNSIDRLSDLAAQMLDLERLQLQPEAAAEMNLFQLAADVVSDMAPLAIASGYDLGLEGPPVPVNVVGDRQSLERAIRNLIANAITHAGGKGQIIVHVAENRSLLVTDEGAGIPASLQPHLFQPFFRERWDREGCGLGLHLTRQIMQAHNGDAFFVPTQSGAAFKLIFSQIEKHDTRNKAVPE